MSRKLIIVLSINLLLNVIFNPPIFAQNPSDSSYIYRVEVSGCNNEPTERRQTGFFIDDGNVSGIVTALHGVADCPTLRAIGTESEFSELEIVKVDIARDIALLWSDRVDALSTGGLRIEADLTPAQGDGIYTVGYPVNLNDQLPTRQMTLRGTTPLIRLVPDNLVKPLYDRESPELGIQVLSIEGHLLPGHSGAPIFNQDSRLIGVGNGGLDSGRIGISWAVPWLEVDWKSVSPKDSDNISPDAVEKLANLKGSNVLFFSFISADPLREETIEKTECKSILNANYENINVLKEDLLISAKRQVVGELFGEFLMAHTQSEGSGLSNDQFTTFTAGYVRTKGDPVYKNHETRLGEICVSIEGFVTSDDKQKLEPVEIGSEDECINENLPKLDLERMAEDRAIIQALVNYDSRLKGQNEEILLRLMRNIDFSGSGYDDRTGAYCATVKGEVLPIEIIYLVEASGSLGLQSPTSTATPLQTPADTDSPSVTTNAMQTKESSEPIEPIAKEVAYGKPASASAIFNSDFHANNILDRNIDEMTEVSGDQSMWLLPDRQTGWIQVDLLTQMQIVGFRVLNTHNRWYNDRATTTYHIAVSTSGAFDGEEQIVETGNLSFSTDPTTQEIMLDDPVTGRFVRFYVDEYHKAGGGLNELEVLGLAPSQKISLGNNYFEISNDKPVSASSIFAENFSASNIVDNETDEVTKIAGDQTMWLLPDGKTGWVQVDLLESTEIVGFRVLNTRNRWYNDRATTVYHIAVSESGAFEGEEKIVFVGRLGFSMTPVFYEIVLPQPQVGRFVRFYVDGYYGSGGGLNEFEVFAQTQDSEKIEHQGEKYTISSEVGWHQIVEVDEGSTVIIRYHSGFWSINPDLYPYVDSKGTPGIVGGDGEPIFGYSKGGLVFRVGDGIPLRVDDYVEFVSDGKGWLELRINECDCQLMDNVGSISVIVEVK